MANKYGLAGAVLALLLAGQTSHAPVARFFNPPKDRLKLESRIKNPIEQRFEKHEENFKIMEKAAEKRFEENKKRLIEQRRNEERLRNYETDDFWRDSDWLLLARHVLGECEGCSLIERIGIAFSPINRLDEGYGKTLKEVILASNQYSAFNPEKDSYIFLKNPLAHDASEFLISLQIAKDVLTGKYEDPTHGATHYFNINHRDLRGRTPKWAKNMTKIGRIKTGRNSYSYHTFYKS